MARGLFIANEGADAVGKRTQTLKMVEYLKSLGRDCIFTSEPVYDSFTGRAIKRMLTFGNFDAYSIQVLFTKDREDHVTSLITPTLSAGTDVVTDRYRLSTIAYSIASGIEGTDLQELIGKNAKFPNPDVTFIMDLDPNIATNRLFSRSKSEKRDIDAFEKSLELQIRVREAFLKLQKETENSFVINADQDIEKIASDVREILSDKLKSLKRQT